MSDLRLLNSQKTEDFREDVIGSSNYGSANGNLLIVVDVNAQICDIGIGIDHYPSASFRTHDDAARGIGEFEASPLEDPHFGKLRTIDDHMNPVQPSLDAVHVALTKSHGARHLRLMLGQGAVYFRLLESNELIIN